MEPENRTGSCGIIDICDRSCSRLRVDVSMPSIMISPSISAMRKSDPMSDDFPALRKVLLELNHKILYIRSGVLENLNAVNKKLFFSWVILFVDRKGHNPFRFDSMRSKSDCLGVKCAQHIAKD